MTIIIFGPPGCGKGTQSILIAEKYNLKHISTGDLLRKEIEDETEFGKTVKSYIAEGKLVPDEVIIGMLMNAFEKNADQHYGIILDGFPRTTAQAEALEINLTARSKKTNILLDLQVETNELLNRLLYRGANSGRVDDNLETIKKRLQVYEEKTLPVKDFYKKLQKYAAIEGMGEIDEIFTSICNAIDAAI